MDGAEGEGEGDAGGSLEMGAAASFTDDLILEILSRLPAKSLHRFKCVSRHWLGLITNPDHRTRLAQTLAGFFYIGYTSSGPTVNSVRFASTSAPPPLIDPPALSIPPAYEHVNRVDCCNGLLLLRCWKPEAQDGFCYAVCNPATDQWAGLPDSPTRGAGSSTVRLAFDPAASPRHFRVFEFFGGGPTARSTAVEIYSSESGIWTHRECGWVGGAGVTLRDETSSVFFGGTLHLSPIEPVIASVDVDGKTWRSAPKPSDPKDDGFFGGPAPGFIGLSQGRLHFVSALEHNYLKLRVWELIDNGVWVPKHSVDLRELCTWDYRVGAKYNIIGIHPDCDMFYFLHGKYHTLVSYAMNRRETCTIRDLGLCNYVPYLPYVPLFSAAIPSLAHED